MLLDARDRDHRRGRVVDENGVGMSEGERAEQHTNRQGPVPG